MEPVTASQAITREMSTISLAYISSYSERVCGKSLKSPSGRDWTEIALPFDPPALIKKKIKFSSKIRKLRLEQLQSHRYYFATASLRISLYRRKIRFSFFSVCAESNALVE
jgi:hypothetical protein